MTMIKDILFYSPKRVFLITLIMSVIGIAVALFWENYMGLKPCMLCYLQRGSIYLIIIISAISLMHSEMSLKTFRLYLLSVLGSIILGAVFAIRQLYLQSLPDELVPSCAPDLDYLLDTLPVFEVLMIAIQGDGNCAEVMWQFLGISIPGWLLISFICGSIYILSSLYFSNDIHSHNRYN